MLQTLPPSPNDQKRGRRFSAVNLVQAIPIRWRILSIAALNSAVVVALGLMIWNGAKTLSASWDDLRQVRNSERVLTILESEAGRLQNLIHRYINQPSPEIFAEILLLREALLGTPDKPRRNRLDIVGLRRRTRRSHRPVPRPFR